jgi:hypothetical protein
MNEIPDIERIPSPIMIDTKENKQVSGATTNFSLGLHLYVQDMRWHAEERSLGEERGKRAWARRYTDCETLTTWQQWLKDANWLCTNIVNVTLVICLGVKSGADIIAKSYCPTADRLVKLREEFLRI